MVTLSIELQPDIPKLYNLLWVDEKSHRVVKSSTGAKFVPDGKNVADGSP
jgi:hypothetical protein